MFTKRLVLISALLLVAGAIAGRAEERWTRVKSDNFEVLTTGGEKKGREVILYFERVRAFFLKATQVQPEPGPPVRIVAFQSEKQFTPYSPHEGLAGYTINWHGQEYVVLRNIAPDDYHVAVHEYVHVLLKPIERKIPLWLQEGLAELYSTLTPLGNKVQIGDIIRGHYWELQNYKWLDMTTLTAVDHKSPYYNESKRMGIFYSESWALTHMLMLDRSYIAKFNDFSNAILSGTPQSEAFKKAYGKSMKEVEDDLGSYMRQGRYSVGQFSVKLEKSAEEPDVREASATESGSALADLLAVNKHWPEAKQAYAAIGTWEGEKGLAYLSLYSTHTEEARAHFARAVEMGTNDAKLYLDYANLETGEKQIDLLSKAVQLQPDYDEAHFRLGLLLCNAGKYGAAVNHFAKLTVVKPEWEYPYFSALAQAYGQLGKREWAVKAIDRARPYANTPSEKDKLDQLSRYLDSVEHSAANRGDTPAGRPAIGNPQTIIASDAPPLTAVSAPQPSEPIRSIITVEGILEQIDCQGVSASLHLRVGGSPIRLKIDDPRRVDIRGTDSLTVEFTCGPQKPKKVVVKYDPKIDKDLGTIGLVTAIEFE